MSEPPFVVGIDLGTTNSVVAYAPRDADGDPDAGIRVFPVPQVTDSGTVSPLSMLPSFLLLPPEEESSAGAFDLPWGPFDGSLVGEFARRRGAELPQRLVSSAKSWLCHPRVDREGDILPWQSPGDIPKLSAVKASAALLTHIRQAWNHVQARGDRNCRLENQEVVLTVPASFDAVARDLTIQSARMAGLERVTLIEEPLSAFYAWIDTVGEPWRQQVRIGDRILVCDVGGGTTDFSLVRVEERNGQLRLERVSVGEHLLVGGDNMDLALAHAVRRRVESGGQPLDTWQMRTLWQICRRAKERLLADDRLDASPLSIPGRGRSLIGGTLRTTLERATLDAIMLEGFFPHCGAAERPVSPPPSGIRELGLNYTADPAVTRHLAAFLHADGSGPEESLPPTAVLFNGGVMKAAGLRRRLVDVISSWWAAPDPDGPRELESRDFDLAVARGAVYYGRARRGDGVRIRSGLNRSYYIGIAAAMPAVPGLPSPVKALCLAPFGTEEGTVVRLEGQQFELTVGQPAQFDFMASSRRREDVAGTVVEDWEGEIISLTTLENALEGPAGEVVPVNLEVSVTEVGTLEVWCVAVGERQRWKLEFNVRHHRNGALTENG